jgi:hypothetical protein
MVVPTLVVRPGEGRSVSLGGMSVVFKVSGADTGGAFAVVEHPIEPRYWGNDRSRKDKNDDTTHSGLCRQPPQGFFP